MSDSSAFAPPYAFDGPTMARILRGQVRGELGTGPYRVTTDSRLAGGTRIFVALKGDRFDGHDFVDGVLEAGAHGAVVTQGHPVAAQVPPPGRFLIVVDDTLRALARLANWVRRQAEVPVIGLTGSSGKTTTKEMIAAMLGVGGEGLATAGNLNNLIGLPLTLLHWSDEYRWMVLEMGMSAEGEIRRLAEIAEPSVRLITNVAPAHLENFDDLAAVARAKGEMFEGARPGDLLVTNADDPFAAHFPRPAGAREIRFGENPTADVRVVRVEPSGEFGHRIWLSMIGQELVVDLDLPGRHNVENAAAAAAVAWAAGVPTEAIVEGLSKTRLPAGRMAALTLGGVRVLDDSYNANPRSVRAALQTLAGGESAGRRIAVLGDMLELGPTGPALHREVGRFAADQGIDLLVAVGPLSWHTMEGALAGGIGEEQALWREDAAEVVDLLRHELVPGDRLLVKGSRGMRMERVITGLKEELGC